MTREEKFQEAMALYKKELKSLIKSTDNWKAFLKRSTDFYKYTFSEQLLIAKQMPNATAVAKFDVWSNQMNRKIKRNAKGTSLVYKVDKGFKMKYVYDVADTEVVFSNSKNISIWKMNKDYERIIKDKLVKKYSLDSNNSFENVIYSIINKLVLENSKKYLDDILENKSDSLLADLDKDNIYVHFNELISESIAYSIFLRCGIEINEFNDREISNFRYYSEFNTPFLVEKIGEATSKINKTILVDIEREIKEIEKAQQIKQNQVILERNGDYERNNEEHYNRLGVNGYRFELRAERNGFENTAGNRGVNREDTQWRDSDRLGAEDLLRGRVYSEVERGERNNILPGRGNDDILPTSGISEMGGLRNRNVGTTQNGLSGTGTTGSIRVNEDTFHSVSTFGGDNEESRRDGRTLDRTDDARGRSNRGAEEERPNGMGGTNEQHSQQSSRDNIQRIDLYLDNKAEVVEKTAAFSNTSPKRYNLDAENNSQRIWNGKTVAEFDEKDTLLFYIQNDIKINGMISQELFNEINRLGYVFENNILKKIAVLPKIKENKDIIGNTSYRYISNKSYKKLPKNFALLVADEIEKAGLKYSGKINEDTITLTVSKDNIEKIDNIIENIKEENIKDNSFTKEEIDIARSTRLVDFLNSRGVQLKRVGRDEYTLPEHDSMRISNEKGFYWNSRNIGGNALDYCIKVLDMDFRTAVSELLNYNGYNREISKGNAVSFSQSSAKSAKEAKELEPQKNANPIPYGLADKTNRVYAYLTKTRGISADTVEKFIKNGTIAQDNNGNAVFKVFDESNNLSGAEISGTTTDHRFKQVTENEGNGFSLSYDNSFFENDPPYLFFCESAIDALSFYDLFRGNVAHNDPNIMKSFIVVSMAGLKDKVIEKEIKKFENRFGKKPITYIYSDNDEAGQNFKAKMTEKLNELGYKVNKSDMFSLFGSFSVFKNENIKDLNDLLNAVNNSKNTKENDINEKLVNVVNQITDKQTELTNAVSNGEYGNATKIAEELANLSKLADELKTNIQKETITEKDVDELRSIEPKRKSVQNMLENEVAQTSKFEKLLNNELKAKSPYEMRNSNNEWRTDETNVIPIIEVQKRDISENIAEIRKNKDIPRGTFINKDTGIEIICGRKAIEEIIAKTIQDDKRDIPIEARMSALYKMQDLIENAICFDSRISDYDSVTSKNKSPNTLFIHRMHEIIEYENKYYLANLSVEEMYTSDKEKGFDKTINRLYSFRDIEIAPVELLGFDPHTSLQNANEDTLSGANISIPQLYEIVKTYDQSFFENPNAIGRAEREKELQAQADFVQAVEVLEQHTTDKTNSAFQQVIDNHNFSDETITLLNRVKNQMNINNISKFDFSTLELPVFQQAYGNLSRINENFFNGELNNIIDEVNSYINNSDKEINEVNNIEKTNVGKPYTLNIGDIIHLENEEWRVTSTDFIVELENTDKNSEKPYFSYIGGVDSFIETHDFTLINKENIKEKSDDNIKKFANDIEEVNKLQNFIITDNELATGSVKEKYQNNINAIKTLLIIENENRQATLKEQEILSKYVGWGGLADVFDKNKPNWSNEYKELKELLSEEEYKNALASVNNAHYTSPIIIDEIYNALNKFGFEKGKILEPAMGIGNFFGRLPKNMKGSQLYGVELDSLTGRIAKQLYPNSNIQIKGFEKTAFQSNSFDVAIGNVPFGSYRINDKELKLNDLIHDYFFKKTLDKVRPGGIIAFITSKGTLDKKTPFVREYLAERADLLGAVRLPNNAFKANAGTEVTTDIIFLQKRESLRDFSKDKKPNWVQTSVNQRNIEMNNYFIDNPDMILGDMTEVSGRFGNTYECLPFTNVNLKELLSSAINKIEGKISENYIQPTKKEIVTENPNIIPENYRNFCYCVIDNDIYFRNNNIMQKQKISGTKLERIKGIINISEVLRDLIKYQSENYPDNDINAQQQKLNTVYDIFIKKYGLLSSNANKSLFKDDDTAPLLLSLENINEKGELESKADIFTKRTIRPYTPITSVDTVSDALAVSIGEKAKVDLDFMAELCSKTKDEIINELKGVIFKNPATNEFETADEYLSGNVREKLKLAEWAYSLEEGIKKPEFLSNIKALKEVQPEELLPSDISANLGSTWIPTKYIQEFMYYLFDTPRYSRNTYGDNPFESGRNGNNTAIIIDYDTSTATYSISNKLADRYNPKVNQGYGTDRINAYKILEETLNLKPIKIVDYVEDNEGKKKAVPNKTETDKAQGKQDLIKEEFAKWVWSDPDRTADLCKIYNEKFNSIRNREYDGSHITFGGINPEIKLRPHQINAIAHTLYGGNTLLAHTVGAGKTFEMVASAMESKRLGLCNKSMIVVPKHIVNQVAKEFLQLYPTANILVPNEKDFSKENRERFCSRIATGNYDAVILSHTQLEKIPLSVERQINFIEDEINEIVESLQKMKGMSEKGFTIKQLETTKRNLENKLDILINEDKRDTTITFEEMGIDKLYVDEAHFFKNLYFNTKMGRNISGINSSSNSQRATDLKMKCRYLDEITGSKGVVFATGTPKATP